MELEKFELHQEQTLHLIPQRKANRRSFVQTKVDESLSTKKI